MLSKYLYKTRTR